MLPKYHIFFGAIFSILLYFLFSITLFQLSIVFFASVFIDLDHYIRYVLKTKNFNLFKFWNWSMHLTGKWRKLSIKERKAYKMPIFIFHGIEFWILISILSIFNKIFLYVLIGIFFHMVLDFIELIYFSFPFFSKFSQITVFIINKNRKEFT